MDVFYPQGEVRPGNEREIAWPHSLPCGMCKIRNDDVLSCLYANTAYAHMLGYSEEETAQNPLALEKLAVYASDFLEVKRILTEKLEQNLTVFEFETRLVTRSGETIWALMQCCTDADCVTCVVFDITRRKQLEEQLRISEEENRVAIQQAGKFLLRYDIHSRTGTLSEDLSDYLKVPTKIHNLPDQIIRNGQFPKDSEKAYRRLFQQIEEGIPSGSSVLQFKRLNEKKYAWYRVEFFVIFDKEQHPLHAIVFFEDITELREKELACENWRYYIETQMEKCLAYYECNLTKDLLERAAGPVMQKLPKEYRQTYTGAVCYAADYFVSPEDKEEYLELFAKENLLKNYYGGKREILFEHRRIGDGKRLLWTIATMQLLPDPYSDDVKGFVLIKDIAQHTNLLPAEDAALQVNEAHREVKNKERMMKYYNVALRNTYDELFEFSITRNHYHIIHHSPHKYVIPAEEGLLDKTILIVSNQLVHPEDKERFLDFFRLDKIRKKLSDGADSMTGEFRKLRESGEYRWAAMMLVPMEDGYGEESLLCFISDIDEKKNAEVIAFQNNLLRQRESDNERYRIIVNQTQTMVLEFNDETDDYYISPLAEQFSFADNICTVKNQYFLTPADVYPDDWALAQGLSRKIWGGASNAEAAIRLLKKDGVYLWCKVALTVLRTQEGEMNRAIVTINDVDEAEKNRKSLEYRAEYDDLTGYGNFSKYKLDVTNLLKKCGEEQYALWYCDLKNFKLVNDLYGYDVGDHVLQYWAKMIANEMGEGETFARVSADHFTAFCRLENREKLEKRFQRMSGQLAEYSELAGKKFRLEVVAGVYLIEKAEDVLSIEDMIDRANIAQKGVKHLGGSRIAFYTEEMRCRIIREKEIEADMHSALQNGEFCVYLQPLVDIQRGDCLNGAEALVRWNRPGMGLIPPNDFIPLFEKNGFISELDTFVFEEVCHYLRHRIDKGLERLKISINVSRISAFQENFVEQYVRIKGKYGIPDGLLELECTETVVAENVNLLNSIMVKLRKHGFLFSLDDFGSGYSSLNLLKDIIVDVLKLDMIFFQNSITQKRDMAIVSSVISMAKALDMKIVAEGVELPEQLRALRELGCDIVQGYLFGRPMPLQEFEEKYQGGRILQNA